MARMRSIKPELFRSLTASAWPRDVRWTFAGLFTYLDDEGRGIDDPRLVKAEVYPLDDDMPAKKVEHHLAILADAGPLCRYDVEGRRYLHLTDWTGEEPWSQRINRPTPSRIPPCPLHDKTVSPHGTDPEPSPPPHGALTEPSVSPHRSVTEGSAPHAQASAPAEHGTGNREQGVGEELSSDAPQRADADRVCQHLADRIEANGSKRPQVTARWHTAARLLLDADNRTEAQIHAAIDWCQDDEFWRSNVLSMPKLREKFDQLRLAAQRARTPANGRRPTNGNPMLDDLRNGRYDNTPANVYPIAALERS